MLTTLIHDVLALLSQLEALFPGDTAGLAREEIRYLGNRCEIQALEDVLKNAPEGLDPLLHQEVSRISRHVYKNMDTSGNDTVSILQGNYVASDFTSSAELSGSHIYENIKIRAKKQLEFMAGDKRGGNDPL